MAIIQITPELLEQKAAEVRRLKEEHDNVMSRMKSLILGLSDQWKGEAQAAFVSKFEGMQPTFTNFTQMLENYAVVMDTSARTMRETDETLKNAINNSGN